MLSRFLFNLREAYMSASAVSSTFSVFSDAQFNKHIGNLGASLQYSENTLVDDEDSPSQQPVTCDDPFRVGLVSDDTVELQYVAIDLFGV